MNIHRKVLTALFFTSFSVQGWCATYDPWAPQGFRINGVGGAAATPAVRQVVDLTYGDAQSACDAWINVYVAQINDPGAVPTLEPDSNTPGQFWCSDGKQSPTAPSRVSIYTNCGEAPFPKFDSYMPIPAPPNFIAYGGGITPSTMCTCQGIDGSLGIPAGTHYQRYFDTGACVNSAHKFHELQSCPVPKSDHSIYPLTGNNRFDVPLGRLLGRNVYLNFDSLVNIPSQQPGGGLTNLSGPASFGELWQSSFHKRLILQAPLVVDPVSNYPRVSGEIVAQRGLNQWLSFHANASTNYTWAGDADVEKILYMVPSSSGAPLSFTLVDRKTLEVEAYDGSGILQSIAYATGLTESYSYSTSIDVGAPAVGLLTSISQKNVQGDILRTIRFNYFASGDGKALISSIVNEAAEAITFTYLNSNLTGMHWLDGTGYGFEYKDINHSWAVTGVKDVSSLTDPGTVFANYGYDSSGYARSSVLAGGVDGFSSGYATGPTLSVVQHWDEKFQIDIFDHVWIPATGVSMTLPNGTTANYGSSQVNGLPRLISSSQPAGAGCAASVNAASYDSRGNMTQYDDFNGNRVCYAYEYRNQRTIAVEGLPSSKLCPATLATYLPSPVDQSHPERKSTTNWNSYWLLKSKESSPKEIVIWAYNGEVDPYSGSTTTCAPTPSPEFGVLGKPLPLVCQRHVIATSDASGGLDFNASPAAAPVRTWQYTYNQFGEVLTETTPKQSATDQLSHTTNYTYYSDTQIASNAGHTAADLFTLTNALGQMTTYLSYDASGRLLSSVDENGIVTTQSYWPRGWVQSQTLTPPAGGGAPQTTSFKYWPTGLIKVVTRSDGSTLSYVYDDAHRLTDITDAVGNTVHYVLDKLGNRVNEQVSDSSGNLIRTVTQVFDALNRLQTKTGVAH